MNKEYYVKGNIFTIKIQQFNIIDTSDLIKTNFPLI